MRKKLAVELALPVLVFGAIGASFFLKDPADQPAVNRPAGADAPFREGVERRMPDDASDLGQSAVATNQRSGGATFRVPTAATAPYSESDSRAAEMSASYKRTFGSILNPLPQSDSDASAGPDKQADRPGDAGDTAAGRVHRISDGDTLRKLATAYLGDSDRYLEIFELNRSTLSSPDLLPIGEALKIPPRERPLAQPSGNAGQTVATQDEEDLPLAPIPKGALGKAAQ